jgi:hypothetical protein
VTAALSSLDLGQEAAVTESEARGGGSVASVAPAVPDSAIPAQDLQDGSPALTSDKVSIPVVRDSLSEKDFKYPYQNQNIGHIIPLSYSPVHPSAPPVFLLK